MRLISVKYVIYGDQPDFISDNQELIEHVPHEATARVLNVKMPVKNFYLLVFLSSLIPDLSSEYLLFSDDYYLLQDYPIEEACKDRYLEDLSLSRSRGSGLWIEGLWRTYDTLIRLGYTGYNFETHTPSHLTRKWVLDAYCEFKDFITEDPWYGFLGLTSTLNHAYKKDNMPLTNIMQENSRCGFWHKPPIYEQVISQSKGKTFFNFDDFAFCDAIKRFLMEKFPEKSKYEK